jgi:hypothetical protein
MRSSLHPGDPAVPTSGARCPVVGSRRPIGGFIAFCICTSAAGQALAQEPEPAPLPEQPSQSGSYPQQPPPGYAPAYQRPGGYPPSAASTQPELPPGAHTHDGFFFRSQLGGGGTVISGPGFNASGGLDLGINLALGAALSQHWVLKGELSFLVNPYQDSAPFMALVSAGLLYYLADNTFIGGGLGYGGMAGYERYNSKARGAKGALLKVEAGHEWWVSDNWALGYAAELFAGLAKENETFKDFGVSYEGWWEGAGLCVLLSATYN